jgi:hypothetical protein
MANPIRLLEIAVVPSGLNRWKWSVTDRDTEIACGYAVTRKAAQAEGDSALFTLLSISKL